MRYGWRVQSSNQDPGLLSEGVARFVPIGVAAASLPRSFALERPRHPVGTIGDWPTEPEFTRQGEAWAASWRIEPGTSLYGTGEVAGPLLRTGFVTEAWATQPFRIEDDGTPVPNYDARSKSLYQAHPWVLALRSNGTAFGVLADTTYRVRIDLRDGIRLTCPNPFPVIVVEGDHPQGVVQRLAELTGRIELPPRWTLGYHQCRFSYYPDARVRAIAEEFRRRKIPCDGIWVDIHYMDAYKVFTFDPVGFPDPKATNDYLHAPGLQVRLDPRPRGEGRSRVIRGLRRGGSPSGHFRDRPSRVSEYRAWTWPGDAAFPDYTRPETRRWWKRLTKDFLQSRDGRQFGSI